LAYEEKSGAFRVLSCNSGGEVRRDEEWAVRLAARRRSEAGGWCEWRGQKGLRVPFGFSTASSLWHYTGVGRVFHMSGSVVRVAWLWGRRRHG